MAARVQIIVEANDFSGGVFRGLTSQLGAFGGMIQELTSANLNWGNVAQQATELVVQGVKSSIDAYISLADQVRQLSLVSGQSTEETSRFVHVLSDFKIGADDALTATRALTKQGLAPSIETLANLSDQYLALNDAQDKNEFILKNLGRAGLQWVDILSKGSAAIKGMGQNVEGNLVLTQKAVDEARAYEVSLDELKDTVDGLKVALGQGLIPSITQTIDAWRDSIRTAQIIQEKYGNVAILTKEQEDAARAQAVAEREAADALKLNSKALDGNAQSAADAAAAIKALSDRNKSFMSLLDQVSTEDNNYNDQVAKNTQERMDLEKQKQELISQGWWSESQKIQDINAKLAANSAAAQSNAQQHEIAGRRIVFSLIQQQLASDGLTTSEMNALLRLGVQWGIYSDTVVQEAQAAMAEVSAYVDQLNHVPSNISTTFSVHYSGLSPADIVGVTGRQHGGPVERGKGYIVGERGPEMFVPGQSGGIIPNGSGLGGGNVTIVYAPMISTADMVELKTRLYPLIVEGAQQAKLQGKI